MSFQDTYFTPLSSDLANLLRYFYCKGVYDGAESGDEWAVKEITERDNLDKQFKFISEFQGKFINFNIMFDLVQTQFKHIKPKVIHHWFCKVAGGQRLKAGICYLCDEYYRKGLTDGLKGGRQATENFMLTQKNWFGLMGAERMSEEEFMKEIKSVARYLQVTRSGLGTKMEETVKFIASAIRQRTDYYYKIKNETE